VGTPRKRVLLATWTLPPSTSGSAVILYELLRNFPQEDIVAIHTVDENPAQSGASLAIERHEITIAKSRTWTLRCMRRAPRLFIPMIRRRIVELAHKHRVQSIYAHFPNHCFTIAAWQAAKLLGLPLVLYMDILWEEAGIGPRSLAKQYERDIVRDAAHRFALTEFAASYLQDKHGVPFALMPHVVDVDTIGSGIQPLNDGEVTVHFSGSIYEKMNLDAMVRLAEASKRARCRPRLDVCAPDLPVELSGRGITTRYLNRGALAKAQAQSTMLYLPQAFSSPQPLMIRNNFPTKAIDYLRSGRPILVHSPADSYLSYLARREGFGLVVDDPNVDALADGIDRLHADANLQRSLVENAQRFARSRDARVWSHILWNAITEGCERPAHGTGDNFAAKMAIFGA
jgi:hypothetical protein